MSHKKFGPDRFSRFDVYWIQTDRQADRQTDRQAKFIYRYSGYLIFQIEMDSVTEPSPGNKGGILKIKPPEEFPFPFPPYSIQTQFMEALFNTLNKGITVLISIFLEIWIQNLKNVKLF